MGELDDPKNKFVKCWLKYEKAPLAHCLSLYIYIKKHCAGTPPRREHPPRQEHPWNTLLAGTPPRREHPPGRNTPGNTPWWEQGGNTIPNSILIIWDHEGMKSSKIISYEIIRYPLGSSGIIWDHLGSSGIVWDHASWDHLG